MRAWNMPQHFTNQVATVDWAELAAIRAAGVRADHLEQIPLWENLTDALDHHPIQRMAKDNNIPRPERT